MGLSTLGQVKEVPIEVEVSIEVAMVGEAEVFLSAEARVGLNPVLSAWPCSMPFTYSL